VLASSCADQVTRVAGQRGAVVTIPVGFAAMPAAPNGVSFETGHADMVHDTQLDYYGRVRRLPGPRLCASTSLFSTTVSSHTLCALFFFSCSAWPPAAATALLRSSTLQATAARTWRT